MIRPWIDSTDRLPSWPVARRFAKGIHCAELIDWAKFSQDSGYRGTMTDRERTRGSPRGVLGPTAGGGVEGGQPMFQRPSPLASLSLLLTGTLACGGCALPVIPSDRFAAGDSGMACSGDCGAGPSDPGCPVNGGGCGEAAVEPEVPWPRFHPVPTRPVFGPPRDDWVSPAR